MTKSQILPDFVAIGYYEDREFFKLLACGLREWLLEVERRVDLSSVVVVYQYLQGGQAAIALKDNERPVMTSDDQVLVLKEPIVDVGATEFVEDRVVDQVLEDCWLLRPSEVLREAGVLRVKQKIADRQPRFVHGRSIANHLRPSWAAGLYQRNDR